MQLRTPRRLPDAPAPACNDRQNTSAQTSQANNKRTARSLKRKLQGQPWCTGLDEKNTLAHQELNCQDRSPCRTWRDGERTEELAPASLTTHLPISSTQPPPQLKSRASEASNCGNTTGYGSGRSVGNTNARSAGSHESVGAALHIRGAGIPPREHWPVQNLQQPFLLHERQLARNHKLFRF